MKTIEVMARAICRSRPNFGDPSCVMDEHPEREKCNDNNCMRFESARAALQSIKEPDPHVVAAVADKLNMEPTKVAAVWMLMVEECLK